VQVQRLAISLGHEPADAMLARLDAAGWTRDVAALAGATFPGATLGLATPPHAAGVVGDGTARGTLPQTGILRLGEDLVAVAGWPLGLPDPLPDDAISWLDALEKADGLFAAAIWNAQARRLHLVTDFLGAEPLYHQPGQGWASAMRAFGTHAPDPAGWGAFFAAGHLFGDRTLLAGTTRVEANATVTLDLASGTLTTRVRQPATFVGPLDALFDESVAACARSVNGTGVLMLSGGFDSRLILGSLLRQGQRPPAMIVRHLDELGDADGEVARLVAATAGLDPQVLTPADDFFASSDYLAFLEAIDGAYPSYGLFIAKVAGLAPQPAAWDGLIPNYALRNYAREPDLETYMRAHVLPGLSRSWEAASRLFRPGVLRDMEAATDSAIATELAAFPNDADGLARWLMANRMRRRPAAATLQAVSGRTLPLTAGATRAFVASCMTLSVRNKAHFGMYRALLEGTGLEDLPVLTGGRLLNPTRALRRRADRAAFARNHPRLARLLGHRADEVPSPLLRAPALFADDDAWLDPVRLRTLAASETRDSPELRALFHYRAARWVQDGCLREKLRPGA